MATSQQEENRQDLFSHFELLQEALPAKLHKNTKLSQDALDALEAVQNFSQRMQIREARRRRSAKKVRKNVVKARAIRELQQG